MKFKLDENLPVEILADLKSANHTAETVMDEGLAGAEDSTLLKKVRSERAVFLTLDKGVANIRSYPPEQFSGIVLFRPQKSGRGHVLGFVRRQLPSILGADLAGHLLVVKENSIRIR